MDGPLDGLGVAFVGPPEIPRPGNDDADARRADDLTGVSDPYPVLNEEYATQIARDWNVKESGSGFVTRFDVSTDYLDDFEVQQVGGSEHLEYWIPAAALGVFNANIIGRIEVIAEFHKAQDS